MGLERVQNRVQNGLRMTSESTLQTGPQMTSDMASDDPQIKDPQNKALLEALY